MYSTSDREFLNGFCFGFGFVLVFFFGQFDVLCMCSFSFLRDILMNINENQFPFLLAACTIIGHPFGLMLKAKLEEAGDP